jgi:hypothetical protein
MIPHDLHGLDAEDIARAANRLNTNTELDAQANGNTEDDGEVRYNRGFMAAIGIIVLVLLITLTWPYVRDNPNTPPAGFAPDHGTIEHGTFQPYRN